MASRSRGTKAKSPDVPASVSPAKAPTALDPKRNQRRIYISMRIPQARDEIKNLVTAIKELRGRPKPLVRTPESQAALRQLIFCRERMKDVRDEIQRLLQERAAILGPGQ